MAAKRSIPTTLFASPDFFELSSDTVRLLLIGIILDADDEGRGCAHARLLARKLDTTTEAVEQTLKECEAHRILRCYLVEGRPYYVLLHWHKYQVLSRPTPSSYPPPPQDQPSPEVAHTETPQGTQGFPWERTDSPGESLPEEEEEENRTEQEEKRRENAEGEGLSPSVVRFPTPGKSVDSAPLSHYEDVMAETKRVAPLLKLPVSGPLEAIVGEFLHTPAISLVGEAIEARAWMDDPRRNRHGQDMTPAFFRRWLKRERSGAHASASSSQGAPLSERQAHREPQPEVKDPYEEYVLQRIAQVKAEYREDKDNACKNDQQSPRSLTSYAG